MAIIRSCCWWNNVLNGSYGCAVYSFLIGGIFTVLVIFDVKPFQLFSPDVTGGAIAIGSYIQIVTGLSLCITACLLIAGVYRNSSRLLLPWIVSMLLFTLVLISGNVSLLIRNMSRNQGSADLLITIISAVLCILNAYGELCVISHYQDISERASRKYVGNILPEKKSISFLRRGSFCNSSFWSSYSPRSCVITPMPARIVIPHESVKKKLPATFESRCSILVPPAPPPPLENFPEKRKPVIIQAQRQLEAISVLSVH